MNDFERIYRDWHEFAKTRDTERLIALYDEHAVLESPLVPVILQRDSGILRGKAEILAFWKKARAAARTNWCAGIATARILCRAARWCGNIRVKRPKATKWTFWN